MPVFEYSAVNRQGQKIRGSLEAETESEAKGRLHADGLMPLTLSFEAEAKPFFRFERIRDIDILTFTQQLGGLLEAGVPVDRALIILASLSEKKAMRDLVATVLKDIQGGQALSQALSRHDVFSNLYINMIRAGEAGGVLEQIVGKLASFLESSKAFKEEVRTALIYPAFLVVVGGLAVAVMLVYVVPRFASIFLDLGQSLPMSTQILLALSDFMAKFWWALILGTVGLVVVVRMYARTEEGRLLIDGYKLRIPLVKDLHIRVAVSRFCRTLGTMLTSGVPVLHAIRISRDVLGNQVLSQSLADVEDGVSRGKGLAGPFRENGLFPPLVAHMVGVGEETGRLEETLLHVATRYEEESRRTLKRLLGMLEPTIILFMAVVVGFIVLSILVTIFSIYEVPI